MSANADPTPASPSLGDTPAQPSSRPAGLDEPRILREALCLDDFEELARRRLPRPIFGYVAGAAERNSSLRDNVSAFAEYGFVPRTLVDVSRRSQAITLFGTRYARPFGIAPMGINALSAYRGDIVLAAGAAEAAMPSIMSGSSLIPLEDVARHAPGTWFQAYLPGDVTRIDPLIDRVAGAGYRTLVLTVDIPVMANRENNVRTGFSTPLRPSLRLAWDGMSHPRWLCGTFLRTLARHGMPHFENSFATRGAPILSSRVMRDFTARDHLNWEHVARIRRRWQGHLVLKGILHPADAARAREQGVDGIIVSNHGGRQLDGAVSPLRVLPAIVEAAGGLAVMMDGGVRRGTDVLKALALGARCVFVGRPFNYAMAVAGAAGVRHAVRLLGDEVDRGMAMLGVNALDELDAGFLAPVGADRRAT
ncbi:MAG: alpha-hydroxy-acid oxidizing protein [Alcaligenaceae bacterium]|nr:alpha-hydroxy-acid oxidizing protein [Alcaligenaceae bacterium SAGV5]MPS52063.1 alpha-hydroxy-acid oxidizing protein [Alcaligenaceae bacterium SAGV3]MPT55336.1 alpha-hydroxy-acid oxidizing protein [Alcaligenaceae bacterium]